MAEKKLKDDEEKNKEKEEKKKKRENHKKAQQKFKQFNKEQVEKFQKGFDKNTEERKKISEKMEEEKKHQQQIYKKLRHKIRADDRKIIEIREKNNEEINNLYSSPQIKDTLKEFRVNLKSLFDFLIKNTYLPIGDRKHNNEIVSETWHYFNIVFQLNPLIMNAKDIHSIFRSLTKDKQVRKQYYLGLNFEEFQQGLLRIAIKHKTVFNRIADKIKDESMSEKQINDVIEKDIEEKEKNEFD